METVRLEIQVPADLLDWAWDYLAPLADKAAGLLDSNDFEGKVFITDTLGESDDYR